MRHKDRVKVNSSTTGTGAMTLGAAVAGFRTFLAAGLNQNLNYDTTYLIENGTAEIEWGFGKISADGLTLTRLVVVGNHLGTTAFVNFTGPTVISAPPLADGAISIHQTARDQAPIATGTDSVAAGPFATAAGVRGTALGYGAAAAGQDALAAGKSSSANALDAVALGNDCVAGNTCVAIGTDNQAGSTTGQRVIAIGRAIVPGQANNDMILLGNQVYSGVDQSIALGQFARPFTSGDIAFALDTIGGAQNPAYEELQHHWTSMTTSNATPTVLTRGCVISFRVVMAFDILVTAIQRGSPYAAGAWRILGAVRRDASASPVLVGTPAVTEIGSGLSGATVAVSLAANQLDLQVTGVAATNIRWCASGRIARLFTDV